MLIVFFNVKTTGVQLFELFNIEQSFFDFLLNFVIVQFNNSLGSHQKRFMTVDLVQQ